MDQKWNCGVLRLVFQSFDWVFGFDPGKSISPNQLALIWKPIKVKYFFQKGIPIQFPLIMQFINFGILGNLFLQVNQLQSITRMTHRDSDRVESSETGLLIGQLRKKEFLSKFYNSDNRIDLEDLRETYSSYKIPVSNCSTYEC